MGNPPWVRPIWEETQVLAEFEPWFELAEKVPVPVYNARRAELLAEPDVRSFYIGELTNLTAKGSFFGTPAMYDLLVGTQPDFYRAFMIRAWRNTGQHGTVGMLHPDITSAAIARCFCVPRRTRGCVSTVISLMRSGVSFRGQWATLPILGCTSTVILRKSGSRI